jgi:hypothetical protein
VMLFEAYGDHQVSNVATEVEARTIGARIKTPALADNRSADVHPLWNLRKFGHLPKDGNVLVLWDFGTPTPPAENVPNRAGADPHDMDSDTPEALGLIAAYLAHDGEVIDACGGQPCHAPPSLAN